MAERGRVLSSQLHRLCIGLGSRRFRGGCVCVCSPDTAVVPSSGVRPRGVWKSIFPRRSFVFFCSGLFSGAHGRHLASKLSSSSSSLRVLCLAGRFCWPDFLQTKGMCAPRILLGFPLMLLPRRLYLQPRFLQTFSPPHKKKCQLDSSPRWLLTLNLLPATATLSVLCVPCRAVKRCVLRGWAPSEG